MDSILSKAANRAICHAVCRIKQKVIYDCACIVPEERLHIIAILVNQKL